MECLVNVSSKTARLHRRQAANQKRYARLRKSGQVLQHTQAERRLVAAERERQREADRQRQVWLRRATFPVAATVAGAAVSLVFGAVHDTGQTAHLYKPYSATSQLYRYVPSSGSDYPDPPHVPEPDGTFYTAYYGGGTATTSVATGPVGPTSWNPWEWTYGPNILGD